MGTFSRIRYVVAANVNSLLEKAEDPEKLLRALIREMEDAGEDARLAAADLLAEQQHLERQSARTNAEIVEWQERAEQAVAAERDDLARAALAAKTELAESLADMDREREDLAARVQQLEADMATLKSKLTEAKARLKRMHERGPDAPPPARKDDRLSRNERRIRNAMGRFDRLQSQVDRLEARVKSYEVGGNAPSPWAEPREAPADPAVEAELEALKAKVARPAKPAKPAAKPESKEAPKAEAGEAS